MGPRPFRCVTKSIYFVRTIPNPYLNTYHDPFLLFILVWQDGIDIGLNFYPVPYPMGRGYPDSFVYT